MTQDSGERVSIQAFPGCKVDHMKYYAIPQELKNPDEIIIDVGTNDIKESSVSSQDIAEGIADIANQIGSHNPSIKVTVSEIIMRGKRDSHLNRKVNKSNRLLREICSQNRWSLLNHDDIGVSDCLANDGLHLNRKCLAVFASSIVNHLNSD